MHNLNFRERIEKYYSRDIYRTIDNLLIQLHNKSPVSAFDVLEVSAAASLINHYLLNGFIDEKATVFTLSLWAYMGWCIQYAIA